MAVTGKTNGYRAVLKGTGHKATPARVAMLAALEKSQKPLSAETLIRRLKPHNFDQATIYRTLATLKKAAVIRQIDFQRGHALYELAGRAEHHHIMCTACERVEDVTDCCAQSMDTAALKQSGFAAVTRHSLEFFGVCKRCAARRP